MAAIGIGLGMLPAWAAARWLASLACEVSATDPLIWCAVLGIVALTAVAAAWHPARRAMRANPARLLNHLHLA